MNCISSAYWDDPLIDRHFTDVIPLSLTHSRLHEIPETTGNTGNPLKIPETSKNICKTLNISTFLVINL